MNEPQKVLPMISSMITTHTHFLSHSQESSKDSCELLSQKEKGLPQATKGAKTSPTAKKYLPELERGEERGERGEREEEKRREEKG